MKFIMLLVIYGLCVCASAYADVVNDVIRITCADTLEYLEIIDTNINGAVAKKELDNNSTSLFEKYGFVSVDSIKRMQEYKCRISDNLYRIQIDTKPGNVCHGTKIPSISLMVDDSYLIQNLPLADCSNYGVDMIKVLPGDGYIQFFGHTTDDATLYSIYWLKDIKENPISVVFDNIVH